MAEVFLAAIDGPEGFSKRVVIKRLLPHLATDSAYIDMFVDEARLASRFNHANLVQVHELSNTANQYFIVMEYLRGLDLAHVIDHCEVARKPVPEDVALHLIARACEGLHYAHQLRNDAHEPLAIVHRDVSPTNLFVTWTGELKVVDFGVAKYSGAIGEEEGVLKGKPGYMSPEQARLEPIDGRSDLFSAGAVLYELLTLEPFLAAGPHHVMLAAAGGLRDTRQRLSHPRISDEVRAVLGRMLEPRIDKRYATALDAARDLDRLSSRRERLMSSDIARFVGGLGAKKEGQRVPTAIVQPGQHLVRGALTDPRVDPRARQRPRRVFFTVATVLLVAAIAAGLLLRREVTLREVVPVRQSAHQPEAPRAPAPIPETVEVARDPPPVPPRPAARPSPRKSSRPERRRAESTPTTTRPLEKGHVAFDVRPWADVYLGGQQLGTTPMAPIELAEGSYTFTLVNPK
ncbi:MAG TPA: serine/threonine-protein kinase, partial [Myxococcota bacterium]|nr:serine/threonine-protein kinase [Myxococcota bacterium]